MSEQPHSNTRSLAQARALDPIPNSNGTVRAVSTAPVAREAQNETDPIRRMWNALHDAECQPHGESYKFRARCPVHQGENVDALEIYEGVDRRVVFGCYAYGCDKRAILDALGLRWTDMFPNGHRLAERRRPTRPVEPRPLNAGAAFLDTLMLAGFNWRAMVVLPKCPYCDNERTLLWVHAGGGVDVECPDGCHYSDVVRAVETRAAIAEAGVEL